MGTAMKVKDRVMGLRKSTYCFVGVEDGQWKVVWKVVSYV